MLNGKKLGDENNYILNRETQKQFIGNSLERPGVLLKRTEIRET